MRIAVVFCCLSFAACIDERDPYQADPYASIGSLECSLSGVQIVIEGTFDVRLPPDQSFQVAAVSHLASGTKTNVFSFFGCHEWKTLGGEHQQGCMRESDQPETQSVSLRTTQNITAGTMPAKVTIDVSGVAVDDAGDAQVLVQRTIYCSR